MGEWGEAYGEKWSWVGRKYGREFKSTQGIGGGTYYIGVYNKANKGNCVLAVGDREKGTPFVRAKMFFYSQSSKKQLWEQANCDEALV